MDEAITMEKCTRAQNRNQRKRRQCDICPQVILITAVQRKISCFPVFLEKAGYYIFRRNGLHMSGDVGLLENFLPCFCLKSSEVHNVMNQKTP